MPTGSEPHTKRPELRHAVVRSVFVNLCAVSVHPPAFRQHDDDERRPQDRLPTVLANKHDRRHHKENKGEEPDERHVSR